MSETTVNPGPGGLPPRDSALRDAIPAADADQQHDHDHDQNRDHNHNNDHSNDPQYARRWWILAVIGIAQLMIVLDVSIVNIALPDAQKDLGFSNGDRQWIVTAYTLAFGSLLLFFGRLTDLIGQRRTFLIGLTLFAIASAMGGAAPNFAVLVTARALQGGAGAMLAPATLSLLTTTFTDVRERGTAFAVFGGIAGSGAAIGLLVGGLLTEYFNWRWTLFVNLVFVVFALIGTIALIRSRASEQRPNLDLPGTIVVSAGLFGLVYGFSGAESHGWHAPSTWSFLLGGVLLLAVFTWWQTRATNPLLPLRVLLDRDRGSSFLALFIVGAGMFGVFLFLTYYLQATLGYSPVMTGLAFLPMVGILMVAATLATTWLMPRISARWLAGPGMLIAAAGMVWLTGIAPHSSFAADILGPVLLVGVGIGLVVAPAMNIATFGVDAEDAGVASATVNTMQQIGGSIGTALLNTLAASAAASYLVGKKPTPDVLVLDQIHSYTTAFWWSAGIFTVGGLICGALLRPGVKETVDPNAAPAVHM
jgi:EmrB/QacA subfamily drug resistance transporter